ncbi:unnamed protein product [Durusdinium trenchii]
MASHAQAKEEAIAALERYDAGRGALGDLAQPAPANPAATDAPATAGEDAPAGDTDGPRRTQCGLILNGCLTEHEVPNIPTIIAYDTLQELNAGNFLARRSLEDMQATEGQYYVEGREQHHQKQN